MIASPQTVVPTNAAQRMFHIWLGGQTRKARAAGCLPQPGRPIEVPEPCKQFIAGKRVLVTGSSKNIGEHIALQLQAAGAQVITSARSRSNNPLLANASHVTLDLADKTSINMAVKQLTAPLDVLVLNAGVASNLSFEVNVLGNARFLTQLMEAHIVVPGKTRVVVVTGDIYATENDCDFGFKGLETRKYSQSKLGLNWWCLETLQANAALDFCLVHPGVVDTDLVSIPGFSLIKRWLMLTSPMGAYAVSMAASLPENEFRKAGYLINTVGWAKLSPEDPMNRMKRRQEFAAMVNSML